MIRAADSSEVITRRIKELRYAAIRGNQECYLEAGLGRSSECWCSGRGLKGVALPCPVKGEALPAATVEIPL